MKLKLLIFFILFLHGEAYSSLEKTTPCCWCVNKWTEENEVSLNLDSGVCTQQKKNPLFKSCRVVDVVGKVCSFVKVSARGAGINCQVQNLFYLENGNKIQIPTPELTMCWARSLKNQETSGERTVAAPTQEKGKRRVGRQENVCSCTEDPVDAKKCIATLSNAEGVGATEYGLVAPGDNSCAKECKRLLGESTFAYCDRFRH